MTARDINEFTRVSLHALYEVRRFFKQHGAGHRGLGYHLPFIAHETRLSALDAMAALCFLIEHHEVDVTTGRDGWVWSFRPKGAAA